MKKTVLLAAVAALAVFGGAKFIKKDSPASRPTPTLAEKIRLAYVGTLNENNTLVDFAEEKGFFKNNNLEVEKVLSDKNIDGILEAGGADAGITGLSGSLSLYLNDTDPKILANIFRTTVFPVSRYPQGQGNLIKKAALVRFGGAPQMMTEIALEKLGANPSDVEMIAMPDDAGKGALLDKEAIDFTVFRSKQFVDEQKFSERFFVYSPRELLNDPSLLNVLSSYPKTISEKPAALQALVSALYQTIRYIENNPEEIKSFIQRKYDRSPEQAAQGYDLLIGARKDVPFVPRLTEIENSLAPVNKVFKPSNSSRNLKDIVYPDFAQNAAK